VTRASLLRLLLDDLDTVHDPNPDRSHVSTLVHCRQTATRALRDGASSEWAAVGLLHDVAHELAPATHADTAAAMLGDRLSHDARRVLATHSAFQHDQLHGTHGIDIYNPCGWHTAAIRFAEWDRLSFDPLYPTLPLDDLWPHVLNLLGKDPA